MLRKDENKLYLNFHNKLIAENLICNDDNISIQKIHPKIQNDKIIYHYIVTNENTNTKYFIRTLKEKDYSYAVMDSLNLLNIKSGKEIFPCALTPPFTIEKNSYIITTYLDGEDLESRIELISNEELLDLSYGIDKNLKLVHSVTNDKYSEGIFGTEELFVDVMCKKFAIQFYNPKNIFFKGIELEKLLDIINSILSQSQFSKPTLVHMDIKPANIIVSPQKETHLIDFELSRFADLDYEWTNLLIKTIHTNNKRYKQYVLNPIIEKNFLSLDKAILIDKYKVYLLYLAINKYLYCCKSKSHCPDSIINLINHITKELI